LAAARPGWRSPGVPQRSHRSRRLRLPLATTARPGPEPGRCHSVPARTGTLSHRAGRPPGRLAAAGVPEGHV